jgi:type III secretory pathway component EscV
MEMSEDVHVPALLLSLSAGALTKRVEKKKKKKRKKKKKKKEKQTDRQTDM